MAPPRDYGPVQLAQYLVGFYGPLTASVDRARFFGLLPQPDRSGGKRWSAALAEEIRARWSEIAAAAKCIGAAGLKKRGWTEAMIKELLGEPDLYTDNPHYSSAAPMRLWRLQRAEAVGDTEDLEGAGRRMMNGAGSIVPRPGSYKPGVTQVRLVGPPEVIDAALALLADLLGEAWQPSTRKPGRHAGGDHLQYGTLIVPVTRGQADG